MVAPGAAAANLIAADARWARWGATASTRHWTIRQSRVPEGASVAVIRAFMAHHQGMTIVAIADALLDGVMRARFHAEPMIQATELLLQERMPRDVAIVHPWEVQVNSPAQARFIEPSGGRSFHHRAPGGPGIASALQWPLHDDAHHRRAPATQAGTISRSRAGARMPRVTITGVIFLSAIHAATRSGRPDINQAAWRRKTIA